MKWNFGGQRCGTSTIVNIRHLKVKTRTQYYQHSHNLTTNVYFFWQYCTYIKTKLKDRRTVFQEHFTIIKQEKGYCFHSVYLHSSWTFWHLKDEINILFQNTGNQMPSDTLPYPIRMDSLSTSLLQPKYYLVTNASDSVEEFLITRFGCCLVILTTELYTVMND